MALAHSTAVERAILRAVPMELLACVCVCVCWLVCVCVCVCADGNPLSTSAQGAPLPQHCERDVAQRARPPLELALPRSEAGRRESKRGKEI